MASALVDLTPYLGPGWQALGTIGYYIHRRSVYLVGTLGTMRGAPAATAALLTGLPESIRPLSGVSRRLPIDPENTTDPANPALELPTSAAATLTTSGDLILDADPPVQVNTTPDPTFWFYYLNFPGQHPQYVEPLTLALGLGGIGWPLFLPLDDTVSFEALAPYLGAEFEDIDSGFLVHGSRVHLNGRVRARTDGASVLLDSLPPGSNEGLSGLVSITDASDTWVINVTTTAEVSYDFQPPVKPAGQSPPLALTSPPGGVTTSWSDPFNFITQDPTAFADEADREIGVIHDRISFDNGYYECDLGFGLGPTFCSSAGPVPGVTITLADLLAQCRPSPDFFFVQFGLFLFPATDHDGFNVQATSGCIVPISPTELGGCGAAVTFDQNIVMAGATVAHYDGTTVPSALSATGASYELSGFFKPPVPAGYTGALEATATEAEHPDASLLWAASQADDITVAFDGLLGGAVPGGGPANILWYAEIQPLYHRRQIALHAGDILDLTGRGWPGLFAPVELPPSQIAAGVAAAGIRPRGGHPE